MKTTDLVDNQSLRADIPTFFPGDELQVHVRSRLAAYEVPRHVEFAA